MRQTKPGNATSPLEAMTIARARRTEAKKNDETLLLAGAGVAGLALALGVGWVMLSKPDEHGERRVLTKREQIERADREFDDEHDKSTERFVAEALAMSQSDFGTSEDAMD